MSYQLSQRRADQITEDDLLYCRDGHRRYIRSIRTNALPDSVHITYDDGAITIAAPDTLLTVATWIDPEEPVTVAAVIDAITSDDAPYR